ncbi:hypothetical protein EDD11_001318 [Mortierella claussenii]|nr:hypothetical protein EDD11_001318 [Mortierella claussenii]
MSQQDTSVAALPSGSAAAAQKQATMTLQTEDEYEQLKRFQIELEFVQCLANPWYLHHLAQQQYFNQDAFVRYLDYLQYFRKPEYAKYIIYPHCLHFLTLLQHKSFRDHLAKQDTATFVHERQYYHWQYLRNQDKVVRMEIMPDGSLIEIKSEPPMVKLSSPAQAQQSQGSSQQPQTSNQEDVTMTSAEESGSQSIATHVPSTGVSASGPASTSALAAATPGAGIGASNGPISL